MKKITLLKTRNVLNKILILFFLISFCATFSQKHNFKEIKITEPICTYHPDPEPFDKSKIENLRKSVNLTNSACSNFVVNYDGFTPEAQAAFQYAVDIWAHIIESQVPINVNAKFEVVTNIDGVVARFVNDGDDERNKWRRSLNHV